MTESQEQSPLIDPNMVKVNAAPAPVKQPAAKKKEPDKGGFIWGTGRRKSSVARVRIKPGSGNMLVNDRKVEEYFKRVQDINSVTSLLKAVNMENSLDVFVNVNGGGTTGQAGAVVLGIARALKDYDPSLLKNLRDGGYLTRDGRMVERKKPGRAGARKRFQFSKR